MRHHEQPLGELLHAGPPPEPPHLRAAPNEHVLHPLADHAQLVDAPNQPLEPGFGHERRHRERPGASRIKAKPRGDRVATDPHTLVGHDPGKHRRDAGARNTELLA